MNRRVLAASVRRVLEDLTRVWSRWSVSDGVEGIFTVAVVNISDPSRLLLFYQAHVSLSLELIVKGSCNNL